MGIRRLALVAAILLHVDQLETGTGAVCRGAEGDLGGPGQQLLSHVEGGASVLMATLHPTRHKDSNAVEAIFCSFPKSTADLELG